MARWAALGGLLRPTGPRRLHQETLEAVLRDPEGLLRLLLCHVSHCLESAGVIAMTLCSQDGAFWLSKRLKDGEGLCVPLPEWDAPLSPQ